MDDSQLNALFAADEPVHDPAFTLAVLQRMEKIQLRQQFITLTIYALIGAVILFALSPLLAGLAADANANILVFAGFVLASLWLVRRDLPGAQIFSI